VVDIGEYLQATYGDSGRISSRESRHRLTSLGSCIISSKYPDGVFRVPIYPFGVTTVLTNDKLIAELRNAPEEALSMDLSFRIVRTYLSQSFTVG
jgi:hypothetical protein